MPIHSPWPLNPDSRRWLLPPAACAALSRHPLGHELWPGALGVYRQAAGHAMAREAAEHGDHLLLYCVQGRGEVRWAAPVAPVPADAGAASAAKRPVPPAPAALGMAPVPVGPGTLVVLPAGVAHAYRADPGEPWTLYWVHFDGPRAADFLAPLLEGEPALAGAVGLGLVPDFEALMARSKEGFVLPSLLHAANLLRALLTHAALLAQRHQARRGRFDVWAVQAWMQAHLDEPITLDQLAEAFGYERFHFAKTYRRLTGRAPLTHFLHLKMERAARLLDGGELRVGEVARVLGYDDAHYFSRQFRRLMGVAPSEYRALKRG